MSSFGQTIDPVVQVQVKPDAGAADILRQSGFCSRRVFESTPLTNPSFVKGRSISLSQSTDDPVNVEVESHSEEHHCQSTLYLMTMVRNMK